MENHPLWMTFPSTPPLVFFFISLLCLIPRACANCPEMLPNDVVSNVPDITSTDVTKQDPIGLEQGSANFPRGILYPSQTGHQQELVVKR